MKPIPLVRVWMLLPFVQFLNEIGAPSERILEAAKIPIDLLQTPGRSVPFALVLDFIARAARAEGADSFGIDVGLNHSVNNIGGWHRLLANNLTLYDQLATCARLASLIFTGQKNWLEIDGPHARWHGLTTTGMGPKAKFSEDFSLMLALETIGRAAGTSWKPEAIHVRKSRSDRFKHYEYFKGVPIVYGSNDFHVVFSRDLLSRPLPKSPDSKSRVFVAEDTVWSHAPARDFVGSLEDAVTATLSGDGCPTIDQIAGIAGTSVRTLQRELHNSGLSFSRVLDRVRFRLANVYLRDPKATIIEVAYQLGYSDPSAFSRAFRRMTGESPAAYQKSFVAR